MIIPEPAEKEMDIVDVFERCLGFMKSGQFGALATSLDAIPRVRAMEYAVDDAGIIFMLTEGGRKVRDILLNPQVSFAIWGNRAESGDLYGLTITTRAEVVDPGDRKRFKQYYLKYKQYIQHDAPNIDELPRSVKLIRVIPDSMELFDPSLKEQGFSPKQVWRR